MVSLILRYSTLTGVEILRPSSVKFIYNNDDDDDDDDNNNNYYNNNNNCIIIFNQETSLSPG